MHIRHFLRIFAAVIVAVTMLGADQSVSAQDVPSWIHNETTLCHEGVTMTLTYAEFQEKGIITINDRDSQGASTWSPEGDNTFPGPCSTEPGDGGEEPDNGNGDGGEEPGDGNGNGGEEPGSGNGNGGEEPGNGNGNGGEEPGSGNGNGGEEPGNGNGNGGEDQGNGNGDGGEEPGNGNAETGNGNGSGTEGSGNGNSSGDTAGGTNVSELPSTGSGLESGSMNAMAMLLVIAASTLLTAGSLSLRLRRG